MRVFPTVRGTRFAQLGAGELFLYEHSGGTSFGFAVEDPTKDGDKLLLPLGPVLPPGMNWPMLQTPSEHSVISFGREFTLRLPVAPNGWSMGDVPPKVRAILLVDDRTYFRISFSWEASSFRACFVDLSTGLIETVGTGASAHYVQPGQSSIYATQWEIVTSEREPRVLLASRSPE